MAAAKDIYKSSFGLLRGNPKISGNVMITTDSTNNLWLNSIESNSELTKNQYKGYRILSNSNYAYDCYNFFNQGKTPTNIIFGLKNEDNQSKTYTQNLENQYDTFYHCGTTLLSSSKYTEEFSYYSPFWMGENIPGYFVIYRIDDPIDYSYQIPVNSLEIGKTYKVLDIFGADINSSTYLPYTINTGNLTYKAGDLFVATDINFTINSGSGSVILFDPNYNISLVNDIANNLTNNILPKSKIVKTYSLGPDSNIGKYLRKIQNDPNYTQNLIDIKFEENIISTYNGVSVENGIFAKKGEYLHSLFTEDSNIIEFENYITKGFERNGIISTSLLNLEFLFDDPDADMYSINRYIGLYVDNIPTGNFQLSGSSFYSRSTKVGNFPEPKNGSQISNQMIVPFNQTNSNGIRLFIDNNSSEGYIPSSDDININERLRFFYVKDKNNNFYSYNQITNYDPIKSSDSYVWGDNTPQKDLIVLSNKSADLSLFSGIDPTKTKEYFGEVTGVGGKSYSVISILDQLSPGNAIVFYHPFGKFFQNNRRYDYFVASDLEYVLDGWGPGSYVNDSGTYYFHPFGTSSQISKAIAGCFNSIDYKSFQAFEESGDVVIRTNGMDSNNDNLFAILAYNDFYNNALFNIPDTIIINDIDSVFLTSPLNFVGGSKYTNTRIKIKLEDSKKINPGKTCVRTTNGLSIVKSVTKCIDQTDYELTYNTIKDYNTHAIIEISDNTKQIAFGYLGTFIAEEIISIETGVFSLYPIKDFDFDFFSSDYGKILTDEYYRYIDVQPDGLTPIYPGIDYTVALGAVVMYNNVKYGDYCSSRIFRGQYTSTSPELPISYYTLLQSSSTAKSNVIPSIYVKSINSSTNDPQADLDKFPGFTGLQDIKFLNDTSTIFTKNQELNFGKTNNEYDVLQENYQRSLVVNSRVMPYISKWVYEGGTDVRGNPYRLNASHTFTPLNFSPSFFSPGRDPLYFTNEWYLLENIPMSATPNLLKNSSNYCVSDLSVTELQNADPSSSDYFLNYFTIEGNDYYEIDNVRYSNLKNKDVEERYTFFNYNSASGYCETLFRGVKLRIKQRTKSALITNDKTLFKNNDSSFQDYKFSCILKSIEDPDPFHVTTPITYNVYRNDTFKTITLVITIIMNDSRFIDLSTFADKMTSNLDNKQHYNDLLSGPSLNIGNNIPVPGEENANSLSTTWFFNPIGISGSIDYFGIYSISDKLQVNVNNIDTNIYNKPSKSDADSYHSYVAGSLNGVLVSGIGSVKLSSGLNPTLGGAAGIYGSVTSLSNKTLPGKGILPISINPNYDTDLREEIKFYPPSTNTNLYKDSQGNGEIKTYQLYSPSVTRNTNPLQINYNYVTPFPTGVGKNYINFNAVSISNNYIFDFSGLGLIPNNLSNVGVPVSINYKNIYDKSVYQFKGGSKYWDYILNKITFPEIYKLFLDQNPYINYTSTYWDGNNQISENETYILEFIKPSSFSQNSRKIPIEDTNKPSKFASTLVGYQLGNQPGFIEFFRYSGGYSPKFNNILPFDNIKTDKLKCDVDSSFPPNDPDAPYLTIKVSLSLKVKNESMYYGIGSPYEISINGNPRGTIRMVQGSKYKFVFENFGGIDTTTSPLPIILQNFVISTYSGSGQSENIYKNGFMYNESGNYAIFDVPNNSPNILYYELEGEIYSGGSITISEGFEFKNSILGINKDSFGIIKNLNYYKYAINNPFRIDPSSGYNLEYPLIGETPIDRRNISLFETTWDAGRYRQYIGDTSFNYIPGTKNMLEQKSMWGSKVMKTPSTFREFHQTKYSNSIDDVFNANINLYPGYEILWEETDTQIKAVLLLDQTTIKHFKDGGINYDFNKFLVSEFCVGNEELLDDTISSYISSNILPIYEPKQINVFIKTIYINKDNTAASSNKNANPVVETIITDLSDFEKISSGYNKAQNNNLTKISGLRYQFLINKDPSLLYSVGFSYIIGKI